MNKLKDFLFNMAQSTPVKLIINNKFHIFLVPGKFGCCKYRDILRKYLDLNVIRIDLESSPIYKCLKKLYIYSEDLERELIEFENEWYDKNVNFLWKGETKNEF